MEIESPPSVRGNNELNNDDIDEDDDEVNSKRIVGTTVFNKNSSGDEIENVNFLKHRTCRGQRLRPLNEEFVISTKHLRYLPTHQTDF